MATPRSYADDPGLVERVFDLIETAFPGLPAHSKRCVIPGGRWQDASTPFLVEQAGRFISHIGVLPINLTIAGQAVLAGGIHAVCTHPHYRRQGHFRRLMEQTLHWCDRRFTTLILFTDQPHLYRPFEFRSVTEHRFRARTSPSGPRRTCRPLNLHRPADIDLITDHLARRTAVSYCLGVTHDRALFSYHCLSTQMLYAEQHDAVIVYSIDGSTLQLKDVVAPRIPPLEHVLACIPDEFTATDILFTPDKFEVDITATQLPPNLMVRGPLAIEADQFMVPATARC